MRSISILLLLTGGAAFSQETLTPPANSLTLPMNENLRHRLGEMFEAQQLHLSGKPLATQPLRMSTVLPATRNCSIPLLNAAAPGKPVPMPTMKPNVSLNSALRPDRLQMVAPAPPCPAGFATPAPPTRP